MQYYPENTVTKYKTHLAQPISLDFEWEVGLFEIEYHRTWYNVEEKDSKIRFEHMKDGRESGQRDNTHTARLLYEH